MFLTNKEKTTIQIKKSRNGKGVFSRKEFKPRRVIFEVTGTLVTCDEDEDISEKDRSNTYRYDKNWYISPKGRLGDMLNHSCEPNAKMVKRDKKLFIEAITPIIKGSEVLIDYSTMLGSDDSWLMSCNCGTPSCRRIIKKFKTLPSTLKKKYLLLGMVPKYIYT